ncbi:MAG TPA: PspC domain-containing protein [Candidatus Kapabacteria bacterium]|jgi:phage shock protein C|nr:PspC domain-containing protein [Ignavibacteria bacterium]HRK59154.1 PspC domain-containing protein [Candidatus Kapabacteria bacterium]
MKKMQRSTADKKLGGVCAGIAAYLGIDVTIIRVAFVIGTIAWGATLLLYVILWMVMPEENMYYSSYNSFYGMPNNSGETASEAHHTSTTPDFKQKSYSLTIPVGIIMIIFGAIMLAANFIPSIDFSDLFPIVFVAIGVILIINGLQNNSKDKPHVGGEL